MAFSCEVAVITPALHLPLIYRGNITIPPSHVCLAYHLDPGLLNNCVATCSLIMLYQGHTCEGSSFWACHLVWHRRSGVPMAMSNMNNHSKDPMSLSFIQAFASGSFLTYYVFLVYFTSKIYVPHKKQNSVDSFLLFLCPYLYWGTLIQQLQAVFTMKTQFDKYRSCS